MRPSLDLETRCDQELDKIDSEVRQMENRMPEFSAQRNSLLAIARLTEERSMKCHACGDQIALEKRYCDGCGSRRPVAKSAADALAKHEFSTSIWNEEDQERHDTLRTKN